MAENQFMALLSSLVSRLAENHLSPTCNRPPMARKTRKDRDLERASKSTIYIDVFINTVPPQTPHQVLLPPPGASGGAGAGPLLLEPGTVADSSSPHASPSSNNRATVVLPVEAVTFRRTEVKQATPSPGADQAALSPNTPLDTLEDDSTNGTTSNRTDKEQAAASSPTSALATLHAASCTRTSTDNTDADSAPRWEKVLWKKQPFSDNYVDDTFLKDLVVNAQVPARNFKAVALDGAAVVQQFSLVTAAVVMPVHLREGRLSAERMLVLDAVLLLLGYIACAVLGGHLLGGSLGRGIRQGVLLVGGVYLLSPLLKTLAATVSEDSVIALTAAALLLHLFLNNYNFVNVATPQLTGTVGLAAAALSAVLVASMMPSALHVFAQVLFALELFLLSPFVRRYIRAVSNTAHVASTVLLGAASTTVCVPCSLGLAAVHAAVLLILGLVCPLALVKIHKYKAKINGPWDEAVPHIPQELHMSNTSS